MSRGWLRATMRDLLSGPPVPPWLLVAGRHEQLGIAADRAANLREVMAAHETDSGHARAWEQQARDLRKLAVRTGRRLTLNGAPPDD